MHRDVYGGSATQARSPLVGRDAVLADLKRTYHRARDERLPSFLLLWGEAGVGKTRLLDEFAQIIKAGEAEVGAATCLEGLCPPFAPLQEAFSGLGLAPHFGGEASPGTPDGEARRYRVFTAAAGVLAATALPRVLFIDDLHWADFATLELLAFLARRLQQTPVLVIATVRSDDLERDHARFGALNRLLRNGARKVGVDPLRPEEMNRLVSCLWPADDPRRLQEIERICTLAEGKPYFAEELISSAVTLRETPAVDPLPLSIRAGILARCERLPPGDRDILLQAAVVGLTFAPELLGRLVRKDRGEVLRALSSARDLQLVCEIEGSDLFAFRHALTREILYRELLGASRQLIHRDLASLLERERRPQDAGLIAFHWSAAGERTRAAVAYERAGDRAAARNAHRDAQDAYGQAVGLREDDAVGHALLDEKYSRTLSINGDLGQACFYLERSIDAYEARGDATKAASLATRLGRRYFEHARSDDAAVAVGRALRLCGGAGAVAYDAHVTLAHFAALQGRRAEAEEQLGRAERLLGAPPPPQRRDFHMVRAYLRATTARLRDAFDDYERAIAIAREIDDREQLTWALSNYASRALATGYAQQALAAYRESAELLPIDEFGKIGVLASNGVASAALAGGDFAAARSAHERARQTTSAMAMTQTAGIAMEIRLAYLADEVLPLDDAAIDEALAVAFKSGETQNIGLLSGTLAAYFDSTARPAEADALRSRAIAAIASADLSLLLIDQLAAAGTSAQCEKARALLSAAAGDDANRAAGAHLALFDARVARRQRRFSLAKTLATRAAVAFEEIGWPWERAASLEVAGRLADAREIYERHGYRRQLRELNSARRRTRHRAAGDRLTARELEVAQLAAAGMSNREIAARLFIGERTVETHISAMFDRFDLTSRRQLGSLVAAQPP
ncbi:MAG TPA: AAA family ATPase [Candidatus Cybelea sp.]|nr:AAA family ATPase [Candidatus Cybelea sp.]